MLNHPTINERAIQQIPVVKIAGKSALESLDTLAIEEPLEIRLAYGPLTGRTIKKISITMRTPGDDAELAVGFLFTEGIISSHQEIVSVGSRAFICAGNSENTVQVELVEAFQPKLQNSERNFYTTSSCGVCGKGSIEAIRTVSQFAPNENPDLQVHQHVLLDLPRQLRDHQQVFDATGGLHACALFTPKGELIQLREDVGRHNALDKLIGYSLNAGLLPLDQTILLLSGRASFELIQKAAMAGIRIIAAVGAPSSLAVSLAGEFGITLVGFLRENRFNIYTSTHRIVIPQYENQD